MRLVLQYGSATNNHCSLWISVSDFAELIFQNSFELHNFNWRAMVGKMNQLLCVSFLNQMMPWQMV